ncbi:MAG TPA: TIM barrel protein, partial [Marmoricola sp.]|nr:TIM barrel protein [Marmoricola sp.]
ALAKRMGPRLRHLHMTDGTGSAKDEHLIPGRGEQPCVELLQYLAKDGFSGSIVLEINTRKAGTKEAREADLIESLEFCREYFASSATR